MIKVSGRILKYIASSGLSIVQELIDHSYELIVQGLKKKDREALDSRIG